MPLFFSKLPNKPLVKNMQISEKEYANYGILWVLRGFHVKFR